MPSLLQDRLREFVPRGLSCAAHVVNARNIANGRAAGRSRDALDHGYCRLRDRPAPVRTAHLVVHDAQLFALRSQAKDSQQEILSAGGIYPAGSKYQMWH